MWTNKINQRALMKQTARFLPASQAFMPPWACLAFPMARAQDNANNTQPVYQVRTGILMLTMPEEKYLTLLPDLLDKHKIEKVIPDLWDAVKNKQITLVGYPMVVTKSGQRAVIETVDEIVNEEPEFPPGFLPRPYYYPGYYLPGYTPVTPTTPVSFETRNSGVTYEVEPVIGPDGVHIDLNLAPQHVERLGFKLFSRPKQADVVGADGTDVKLPLFFTTKVTTSISLASGQHVLIAAHKKEKPEGTIEIFILDAEVITAGK